MFKSQQRVMFSLLQAVLPLLNDVRLRDPQHRLRFPRQILNIGPGDSVVGLVRRRGGRDKQPHPARWTAGEWLLGAASWPGAGDTEILAILEPTVYLEGGGGRSPGGGCVEHVHTSARPGAHARGLPGVRNTRSVVVLCSGWPVCRFPGPTAAAPGAAGGGLL